MDRKSITAFSQWARLRKNLTPLVLPSWDQVSADIDHSAALQRLLTDKILFPIPPPRSFSYPWYALFEKGQAKRCEVWRGDREGKTAISINQSDQWEIVENSEDEIVVRYVPDESWKGWLCHTQEGQYQVYSNPAFLPVIAPMPLFRLNKDPEIYHKSFNWNIKAVGDFPWDVLDISDEVRLTAHVYGPDYAPGAHGMVMLLMENLEYMVEIEENNMRELIRAPWYALQKINP